MAGTGNKRTSSRDRTSAWRMLRARASSCLASCVTHERISPTRCLWKALICKHQNKQTWRVFFFFFFFFFRLVINTAFESLRLTLQNNINFFDFCTTYAVCIRRSYGKSSCVCVCYSTYCDVAPNVGVLQPHIDP